MEAFEVSKLFPPSRLLGDLKEKGTLGHLSDRCLGKSTGKALTLIGESLSNPNMMVVSSQASKWDATHLVSIVRSNLCKLDLKCISVRAKENIVELRYSGTKTVIVHNGELYVKA